jgi:hypothetical protein
MKYLLFFCRQFACPLLPADQRPPRPRKRLYVNNLWDDSSSGSYFPPRSGSPDCLVSSASPTSSSNGDDLTNNNNSDKPRATTAEHLNDVSKTSSKPKGLIDGLSQFFTPTNKRKSRVSMVAATPVLASSVNNNNNKVTSSKNGNIAKMNGKPKPKAGSQQSNSQQAASRLIRKSKLLHINKGLQKKGPRGPRGSGQLKGLFDGLSHLYTAQGERKRPSPIYSPPRRGRGRGARAATRVVFESRTEFYKRSRVSLELQGNQAFLLKRQQASVGSVLGRGGFPSRLVGGRGRSATLLDEDRRSRSRSASPASRRGRGRGGLVVVGPREPPVGGLGTAHGKNITQDHLKVHVAPFLYFVHLLEICVEKAMCASVCISLLDTCLNKKPLVEALCGVLFT